MKPLLRPGFLSTALVRRSASETGPVRFGWVNSSWPPMPSGRLGRTPLVRRRPRWSVEPGSDITTTRARLREAMIQAGTWGKPLASPAIWSADPHRSAHLVR
jgi:hypothetical protein